MKILIMMDGFFPGKKYGGPPVSVDNFCTLMSEHDCYIVARNHDFRDNECYDGIKEGWNDRENCKVKYLSDRMYRMKSFANVIEEINPDVLYVQSLFQRCVIPCLMLAKKYKLRVVLAPRGEVCAGALAMKKCKKRLYIYLLRFSGLVNKVTFHTTSEEEAKAVHHYLGVPHENIRVLSNIPSLLTQSYERISKEEGKANFIFLSRIHPKKNLIDAIRYFRNIKGQVSYDIYGPIENVEYWNRCKEEIQKLPNNVKVRYCGVVSHKNVHELFSKYDAFLFPTLSENYGHVIAEALLVGTMVIISDQTPWTDINDSNAGWAIPLHESKKYEDAINAVIAMKASEYAQKQECIKQYIDGKLCVDRLVNEYNKMLDISQ